MARAAFVLAVLLLAAVAVAPFAAGARDVAADDVEGRSLSADAPAPAPADAPAPEPDAASAPDSSSDAPSSSSS